MPAIIDHYPNVQQDVLETFINRGQLRKLAEPTILSNGRQIPGLKLDHPRQLAVMHSLVRFANLAAGGRFTTADLYAPALDALGRIAAEVAFLKRFAKIYAPLTAGLLQPFHRDRPLAEEKRCELDRLYQRVCDDLDALLRAVGLKIAA